MAISLSIQPESVSLSKNMVHARILSTSYTSLDNYRVVLRVLFEKVWNSNTFAQVAEIEAIPDANGFTNFYLEKILDSECALNTPFRVPDLEDPHPYQTDTLRRYKLEYFEKYGNPQTPQTATTSSAYSVLYGGADWHYAGLYSFLDNVTASNALLTFMPSGKTLYRTQKDVLTFLNHTDSTKYFGLEVKQYNASGVQIGSTLYKHTGVADSPDDAVSLAAWQAAVFPTGPQKLGLDAAALKYTVRVYDMNISTQAAVTAQSQLFTYYIDDTYQTHPSDLIWFGSFNNPHILRATGRKRKRLQIDRQLTERVTGFGYTPTTGAVLQHDRNWNNLFTYRTGAIRLDDADALQELLIENKLLEFTDQNYYRLRLTENNYDIFETGTSPVYLDFDAVRSLAPYSFTKIKAGLIPPEGNNVWETNSNGYWELNTGNGYFELN
jgi:hypothetical protein